MDPKMLKMLGKKKESKMGETEKEAKMNVVKEMRDMAAGEMGKKLNGLKKVTVASDSKEGLFKGLDKAEDLLKMSKDEEEMPEEESSEEESSEDEMAEYADCSVEELDSKIKELEALKQNKLKELA
jgi:hypothetical protein